MKIDDAFLHWNACKTLYEMSKYYRRRSKLEPPKLACTCFTTDSQGIQYKDIVNSSDFNDHSETDAVNPTKREHGVVQEG